MLIVLGLQFHAPSRRDLVDPLLVSANRLVLGPLVAWAAASALGLGGVPWATSILLAGMPTAVMVTILSAELDARPALAVRCVIVSTMLSLATLTVLITLVR
jgi:predicted permease